MESFKELLLIFNRKQKLQFIGLFIAIFIGSIFELFGVSILIPFMEVLVAPEKIMEKEYIRQGMDLLGITNHRQLVISLLVIMILVYIIKNSYLIILQYLQYQILWKNRLKMEIDIMKHYVKQPYMFHVKRNSAEMQRTILEDTGNVFTVLFNVFSLISEAITSVLLIVFLFATSKGITIGLLILLGAFLGLYFKVFKKRLFYYGKTAQKYGMEGLKCIHQIFNGIKEIKVYECEPFFIKEFCDGRKIQISMMKRGAFFQQVPKYMLEMICVCGILGILLLKMILGVDASLLVTQLAVFAVAAYRLMPSANRITAELVSVFNHKASIDLIYHAMVSDNILTREEKAKEELTTDITFDNHKDIVLENVSFSYPGNEDVILEQANLRIEEGRSVAFKGASGAGKTTTADLILGILTPTGGTIKYAGVDISKMQNMWYKHVGYIPQTIYLSDSTIKDNVAFGIENPDEEKIWKALEGAQLKEFVESRPEGLNLRVGESGVRLSGGQRQRIGIARALYNDPEILILDEATSALDNETEAAVMESIEYFKGKKTLIIIAHRLTTIEKCDEIYEIGAGEIKRVR